MPSTKRLVCLANSRKLHGRCVAGREWSAVGAGPWIRPISARTGGEVSEYERQYEDGSDPRVLDVFDIPLLESRPSGFQTENWLLDPKRYWEKVGRLTAFDLRPLLDPVAPLWIDGHSTYNGRNDKVPIAATGSVTGSLRLLHSDQLRLVVCRPGEAFGNNKRRVQLWVTDPDWERTYLMKLDGTYVIGECFLTISLGEAYGDACYKLIAAIIPAT